MLRKLIEAFVGFSGFSLAARAAWVSFVLGVVMYGLSFFGHDVEQNYTVHKDVGVVERVSLGSSSGYILYVSGGSSGLIGLYVRKGALAIEGGKKSIVGRRISFEYYRKNLLDCSVDGVFLCERKCQTPRDCELKMMQGSRDVFRVMAATLWGVFALCLGCIFLGLRRN
ncbi:hypothetical protein [Stutzerimonas kirkiae]|uniref:hypothetical protein n=1 Tax=Stutzerimonas kirkiae TaxID=2211392 RepID=UPI001038365B|nr:hypothetical protein [Stutzerimonas kirkiae]